MVERVHNGVRVRREALGLSQVALAQRSGVTRQSLSAIEAGRATPGVDVALRVASVLGSPIEDLFGAGAASSPPEVDAVSGSAGAEGAGRTLLARIGPRWVSHRLAQDAVRLTADGIVASQKNDRARVRPLRPLAELEQNVVLMGCALGLGLLAERLNASAGPGRFTWLARSSKAALTALAQRHTHVAGVHLVDARSGEANVSAVRRSECPEPTALITLARWEVGLLVLGGAGGRVRRSEDLARPGLRLVAREAGAGAQRVLERAVRAQGLSIALARPALRVSGHLDVARAVATKVADTGVATRDAALAFGLGFIPLSEERYDLALPTSLLDDARIQRLLAVLVSAAFRCELDALGYDTELAGKRVAEVCAS